MAILKTMQLEKLNARILFQYTGDKKRQGRDILYVYSRESFDELNIKKETVDNSQYISIGDTLTLEGYKCKVVDINFKLYAEMYNLNNTTSKDEPMSHNCQIGVFVERLD